MTGDHTDECSTPELSGIIPCALSVECLTVTWFFAFVLLQDQADRIRAAMENSLAQQRASVQKQAESMSVSIPWTAPTPLAVTDCDPVPPPQLSKMIDEASEKQGVDKNLVREVARQESGFRPCAVSNKGAEGLMQLMPQTQAQLQIGDPFDPKQSLEAGSKLLKQLIDRYGGDLTKALSAYNAGARRVDEAGGVPDIPETKTYVLSILTRYLK
jgi:soluble lytic murein transglycosylase-like protein